jgi:hypothetical protein
MPMTVQGFELVVDELSAVRPFQIYTIELKNGEFCEIDFPGALFYQEGVATFKGPGGFPRFFDADSVLQIIPAPAGDAAK